MSLSPSPALDASTTPYPAVFRWTRRRLRMAGSSSMIRMSCAGMARFRRGIVVGSSWGSSWGSSSAGGGSPGSGGVGRWLFGGTGDDDLIAPGVLGPVQRLVGELDDRRRRQ